MALEAATYVSDLVTTNPVSDDQIAQGDDHIRLLKAALKTTFPNANRPTYFPSSIAAKTTGYTVVDPTDRNAVIPVDCSSGGVTINLPNLTTSSTQDGFMVTLIKTDFSSNNITVDAFSTSLINGQLTFVSNTPFAPIKLYWSYVSSQWFCDHDRGDPPGSMSPYMSIGSAPTGYVYANGRTIGNAASAGTERANADTQRLFELLWNNTIDGDCPVSGGRGASASADFAANKRITLPDMRGKTAFGHDTMGSGAAAGVIGSVIPSRVAAKGGAEDIVIAKANLPDYALPDTLSTAGAGAHSHLVPMRTASAVSAGGGGTTCLVHPSLGFSDGTANESTDTESNHTHTINGSVTLGGSGTALPTISPGVVAGWIIKL